MRLSVIFAASAVLLAPGCASGPRLDEDATAVRVTSSLPAPDIDAAPENMPAYRIGAFDTIAVEVFGAEDLGREGMVESSGTFTLPLIGAVQAAGLTTAELSTQIADKLRGRYVRDPQVTVNVREIRSRLVTVDGAVNQPGIYPVIGDMSLLQAIATARGTGEFAQLDEVVIFRTVEGESMAARFSLSDIRTGRTPDPRVYGNDIVVVGENAARRRFKDIMQAIPILGVFTPVVR